MNKNIQAGSSAQYWITQLSAAKRREKSFLKAGQKVVARYRDEREAEDKENKVNILWSNTETMKSALFSRVGQPDVRRQFPKPGLDAKVSRTAAIVMERALVSASKRYDIDHEVEGAVEDMLLPGRGTCWLEMDGETGDQTVMAIYVGWEDFRHGAGKRWNDVPWVGRRHWFSEADIQKSFPDYADKVACSSIENDAKDSTDENEIASGKRAEVWEIWDKASKTRLYVSPDCEYVLRSDSDPYRLEGFFPTPRPVYGVTTTNSSVPRPEFAQYQDQAAELDRINQRINRLTEVLKYCGAYDKSIQDADTLASIGDLEDGEFVPYSGAQSVVEKGGFNGVFFIRDLVPIQQALTSLQAQRDKVLQTIYEITGISDIMRGSTAEYETAEAQEIKARFGSQRFNRKQRAVQNFIRDLMRMKAELIAEHFSREQLEEMTGIAMPTEQQQAKVRQLLAQGTQAQQAQQKAAQLAQQPQVAAIAQQNPQLASMAMQSLPQDPLAGMPPEAIAQMKELANAVTWEDVSAILRSDDRRNYAVHVETDVTAFENSESEKRQRLEYLTTIQGFLTQALPAIAETPAIGPMVKELILFGSRSFKVGRVLEDQIDETLNAIMNMPPQAKPVDPMLQLEQQKLQQEIELSKIRIERDKMLAQIDIQKAKIELKTKQQETQLAASQLQMKAVGSALDNQNKTTEAEIKELELELEKLKLIQQQEQPIMVDPFQDQLS